MGKRKRDEEEKEELSVERPKKIRRAKRCDEECSDHVTWTDRVGVGQPNVEQGEKKKKKKKKKKTKKKDKDDKAGEECVSMSLQDEDSYNCAALSQEPTDDCRSTSRKKQQRKGEAIVVDTGSTTKSLASPSVEDMAKAKDDELERKIKKKKKKEKKDKSGKDSDGKHNADCHQSENKHKRKKKREKREEDSYSDGDDCSTSAKKQEEKQKKKQKAKKRRHSFDDKEGGGIQFTAADSVDVGKMKKKKKVKPEVECADAEASGEASTKASAKGSTIWSAAEFEDNARKDKFLRLLGGKKAVRPSLADRMKTARKSFSALTLTSPIPLTPLENSAMTSTVQQEQVNMAMSLKATSAMNSALEDQFQKAMDMRLSSHRGGGLGFTDKKFHIDADSVRSTKL